MSSTVSSPVVIAAKARVSCCRARTCGVARLPGCCSRCTFEGWDTAEKMCGFRSFFSQLGFVLLPRGALPPRRSCLWAAGPWVVPGGPSPATWACEPRPCSVSFHGPSPSWCWFSPPCGAHPEVPAVTPSGENAGPRAGVSCWQVGVTWTAPALGLMCIPGEICRGKAQDRNARLGAVGTHVLSFFCYQDSLWGNTSAFCIPVLSPCPKCLGKNSGSLLGGWPLPYPCALGQGHSCCFLGSVPWCWGLCVCPPFGTTWNPTHPCPLIPGACPTASKIMTNPCPRETHI